MPVFDENVVEDEISPENDFQMEVDEIFNEEEEVDEMLEEMIDEIVE